MPDSDNASPSAVSQEPVWLRWDADRRLAHVTELVSTFNSRLTDLAAVGRTLLILASSDLSGLAPRAR